MQQPTQQIIQGIREGKQRYFQEVFDAYYENLCQYAFTILRDMDEAEDIVQSMFVKLWEKRGELNIAKTLQAYLYKSVHNLCLNQLEHREVKQKHLDHTARNFYEAQDPEVFPDELGENIRAAINQLPTQCRIIFTMSRFEEMKYAAIADKLGISVNTVENQISKALRILRTALNSVDIDV